MRVNRKEIVKSVVLPYISFFCDKFWNEFFFVMQEYGLKAKAETILERKYC